MVLPNSFCEKSGNDSDIASEEISYQRRSLFGRFSAAFQWASGGGFIVKPFSCSSEMALDAAGPVTAIASAHALSMAACVTFIAPVFVLRSCSRNLRPSAALTG